MNKFNFIVTPAYKSLLSEISKNATKGRIFEKDEDEEPTEAQPEDPAPTPDTDSSSEEPAPSPEAAEDETSEPGPEVDDIQTQTTDANAEADIAQAELQKATAKKNAAEEELKQQGYIKLVSPGGVTTLLQMVIDPALKSNQIDALASLIVKKLAIETPEDYKQFKDETIEFRGIVGFNQLVQSMEKFIGSADTAPQV